MSKKNQPEWVWIEGYEGRYEINRDGDVRSWMPPARPSIGPPPRLLKRHTSDRAGMTRAVLMRADGRKVVIYNHVQVMKAFGNPPPDNEFHYRVGFRDGDKTHCHIENLRWMAGKANSKLSPRSIRDIRKMRREGVTTKAIAKKHGCARGTVVKITRGYAWTGPMDEEDNNPVVRNYKLVIQRLKRQIRRLEKDIGYKADVMLEWQKMVGIYRLTLRHLLEEMGYEPLTAKRTSCIDAVQDASMNGGIVAKAEEIESGDLRYGSTKRPDTKGQRVGDNGTGGVV